MLFIGVSTQGSSIQKLFPIWADLLGLEAEIEGRDLPIGGGPAIYRAAVREIDESDEVPGALVTTHKVDVFRHAGDMFAELDENARLCREVSCISKRGGALIGHAKDPITAGKAMERMFDRPPRDVLCLGAGGAGTAITVHLLRNPHAASRIVIIDRDQTRIEGIRTIHGDLSSRSELAYLVTGSAEENDAVLAGMPERSFIINATGVGKDTPGSPVTAAAIFPRRAIVWELNYRGELGFLRQARRQAAPRELRTHDGWDYFLHGWSEVIAEVFSLTLTAGVFERLKAAAEPFRPIDAGPGRS
jgi:shikimate dehydrogenase